MAPARTPGPSAGHNALELQGRGCSRLSPLPLPDEFVGGFDGKVPGSEGGNLFQLVQLLRVRSGIVSAFDVEDTGPAPLAYALDNEFLDHVPIIFSMRW